MFYENNEFNFAKTLESNWLLIKEELSRLQESNFKPWVEKYLYNQGWDVFGLYAFEKKLENNCCLCPETTKLVESIPGITTAGFSSLAPRTHILPHSGFSTAILRCHLGLIVPNDCGIRVGNKTKKWQEGKCLIFDDMVEHEAWNNSNLQRIVLLIDFPKPEMQKNSPNLQELPQIAQIMKQLKI
jgi:beta-hydroxylase